MASERATYRIVYHGDSAPRFHLYGDRWPSPVADCSETGVRFVRAAHEPLLELGDVVGGWMVFCNGSRVEVSGRVVRLDGCEVALHLDAEPIPFPAIIREQMYLRRHHQVQKTLEIGDPVSRRQTG